MSIFSKTSVVHAAANLASLLLLVTIIMQILLALGILPISMAWGGRQAELTPGLRLASLAAVVVLGLFMFIIRRRAGLIGKLPAPLSIVILTWVVTAFLALNTLGNLTSQSTSEMIIFGSITFLLTLASFIVAASKLEA
jgi:hypothetical protein